MSFAFTIIFYASIDKLRKLKLIGDSIERKLNFWDFLDVKMSSGLELNLHYDFPVLSVAQICFFNYSINPPTQKFSAQILIYFFSIAMAQHQEVLLMLLFSFQEIILCDKTWNRIMDENFPIISSRFTREVRTAFEQHEMIETQR